MVSTSWTTELHLIGKTDNALRHGTQDGATLGWAGLASGYLRSFAQTFDGWWDDLGEVHLTDDVTGQLDYRVEAEACVRQPVSGFRPIT